MDPSGSKEKKAVPRFASFKPLPTAPRPDRRHDSQSRDSSRRDEEPRHRSRHRNHRERDGSRERRLERKERDHGRRSEPRTRANDAQSEAVPLPTQPVKAVKEKRDEIKDEPGLFFIDRKGDIHNKIYGTLHRYSVPRYHRFGRGFILGLPRSYRIDRESVNEDALVVTTGAWRSDASRTKKRSILSKVDKQGTRLLRVRQEPESDIADAEKDFLPFSTSGSRSRREILGDVGVEDDRYGYRSIEGKAKADLDLPSDVEELSDIDSSGDQGIRMDLDEDAKRMNAELTRAVEQNPHDVGAWLKLVEHQETLLLGAGRESRVLSSAEQRSLADVKLSLYEKALKKVGQNPTIDRLLLGRLEEGAKLWDTKKLSAQWQAVLKSHSHFISLWVKYLDFRQTEFLDFTYERCLGTFFECMKLNASSSDRPEKAQIQVYLFLRMSLFMREAGFSELSAGLWQALLEFTFFHPGHSDTALADFATFWESEIPRIGEAGAKGWKSRERAFVEPKLDVMKSYIEPKDIFLSWSESENERICNARLPARSLDEPSDDPFRVILFSDLEETLSLFRSLDAADCLIDALLYYCHLPPLISQRNTNTTRTWVGDNFLQNHLIDTPDYTLKEWLHKAEEGDLERSAVLPTCFPHQNYIHTVQTLFACSGSWFSSLQLWRETNIGRESDIDADWTRRVLRLLVEANPSRDDLAEYSLSVEYACNSKEAKKYAKALLKKKPSSLRLYNCYALIECRSGNRAAAENVWATSLSMSQNFNAADKADSVLLWHAWIWHCLGTQELSRASYLLQSMPQNSIDVKSLPEPSTGITFSPANSLQIQRFLADSQEQALGRGSPAVFVAATDCLAIFSYLAHSGDLDKSLDGYTKGLARLTLQPEPYATFTTELLLQGRARLLYHHIRTSSIYKPTLIRTVLSDSIASFPHNTIFLSLFAWNESRFRIEERVRDVVRKITHTARVSTASSSSSSSSFSFSSTEVPITTHLFSIYTELHRPTYAGSTLHSVRAAFEKALHPDSSSSSSSSPVSSASNLSLWKLYILFEISRDDLRRAKHIFYRAMRACPWSKGLLFMAFSHLRAAGQDGMHFEELRRVYQVLIDKELRVHVEIDESLLDAVQEERLRHPSSSRGQGHAPIHLPEDEGGGEEDTDTNNLQ
ncbi:hypothetical protein ASPZODRAFT_150039 [Penicilliopsis zonata CBS 506.65]|uniref:DUF1740-domain-containing protein n=1 Tax=Penicilliopsis zonata CBS 506.65 TaxID=1073090 RepID=A0A1L9SPC5_9EURO|nr:hypothetical protein ASPZODRAFT_150039 [Penicilliopsis zonata CBS 506.65]OJJ49102.1 hypothetical protein ASPZODRAFT_150039 [Penicilliopsis zonata CBS 506.65]